VTRLTLEEFGPDAPRARAVPDPAPPAPPIDYEAAYGAGWDDAMAQVDGEQARVSEGLAQRLATLERDRAAEIAGMVRTLEPLLHEVFDKLVPHAAARGFLGVLLEEVEAALSEASGRMLIRVAPEEAGPLTRLLEREAIGPDRVTVRPEPALSLSQAFLGWDDQERRVDLTAVLAELDDALSDFLATFAAETSHG
jgi:flagellar assembly protein FliH